MGRFKKLVLLVLSLFVSGFIVGFILGQHFSRDPGKISVAMEYLQVYGRWSVDRREHKNLITMEASPYVYHWDSSANSVQTDPLPASIVLATAERHKEWDSDLKTLMQLAIAAPAGSIVRAFLTETGTKARMSKAEYIEYIALGIVTLGGGILGFDVGYKAYPDTTNDKFIKNLKDTNTWVSVNRDFIGLYNLEYRICLSGMIDQRGVDLVKQMPQVLNQPGATKRGLERLTLLAKLHPEVVSAAVDDCQESVQAYQNEKSGGVDRAPKKQSQHKNVSKRVSSRTN